MTHTPTSLAVRARLASWYARCEAWQGADAALRRSPAQAWFRRRSAGRLAVLGYHEVHEVAAFEAHLDLLQQMCVPVSLAQVEEAAHGGRPLPPHSVLVTFDDGDHTVHGDALPMLAARGIPGVCFVIAGLVGTDSPFWWFEVEDLVRQGGTTERVPPASPEVTVHLLKLLTERERQAALAELRESAAVPAPRGRQLTAAQLRELEAGGIAIGNHTLTHPCLDRCDDGQLHDELMVAHDRLTQLLGHPPTSFAYPSGNTDDRAHRILARSGYRTAFLYNHRLADPRVRRPLAIDRLVLSTRTSPDRLATMLSGLHPALYRVARKAARTLAHPGQLLTRTS